MKQLIISILINLILFNFSFAETGIPSEDVTQPAQPEETTPSDEEILPQTDNPVQATWKIYNFDRGSNATGFFVGANLFVTNFHVISGLLRSSSPEDTDTIKRVLLSQWGGPPILEINRVFAVSALYDLAILETQKSVTDYLILRESPPEINESLSLITYSEGNFTSMKKTGDIIYEDNQRYYFPVNHSSSDGVSGSPVFDESKQVVGIGFGFGTREKNILAAIKTNYLRDLITDNTGIRCSDFKLAIDCIEEEIKNLKEAAEKDYVYAQYQIATMYYNGAGVEQDEEKAVEWFARAAEHGFALAQAALNAIERAKDN